MKVRRLTNGICESALTHERAAFLAAWGVWLATFPLQECTAYGLIAQPVLVVKFVALAVMGSLELMHLSQYKRRDWLFVAAVVVFGISAIAASNTGLFQGVFVVFCARRHSLSSLMKSALLGIGVSVGLVVLSSSVGLIDSGAYQSLDGRGVRESLGFEYPSRLPNYILTLLWTYLVWKRKDRPSPVVLALFASLCVGAFWLTQTRNALVFSLLTYIALVAVWLTRDVSFGKVLAGVVGSVFAVSFVGIWVLSAAFDANVGWMAALDKFMSKRLVYSNIAIGRNPLTPMGSSVFATTEINRMGKGYLDSSYLRLLYYFGVIPALLLIASLSAALRNAVLSKEAVIAAVLVLAALHGVMEGQLILLNYSPFLVAVPAFLGFGVQPVAAAGSAQRGEG